MIEREIFSIRRSMNRGVAQIRKPQTRPLGALDSGTTATVPNRLPML